MNKHVAADAFVRGRSLGFAGWTNGSAPTQTVVVVFLCFITFLGAACWAQVPENTYQELHWRMIGPFRGGRTRAAAGVPSQPNVFYMGQVNGGVWKSDDYGRTWNPIFDHEPTQSIGAIAVAPSDPNIVYVSSGEGLHRPDLSVGDGIYKSTDAGKTWTHLPGLRDGQQIPALAIDPRDPNKVFAAVLGHPYGPSEERGIYRSTDGGQNWQRVIAKDENTGGSDVEIDPSNPDVVYASMWEVREGPWEDNNEFNGPGGGLFKSNDGGSTWHQLSNGLPKDLSQIYLAIAASDPRRLYATLATASGKLSVYRSDDAGDSWAQITNDPRPSGRIGGGDLPIPKVDPKNPIWFTWPAPSPCAQATAARPGQDFAEHPVATGSQLPESEYVAAVLPLLETVKFAVPVWPASSHRSGCHGSTP